MGPSRYTAMRSRAAILINNLAGGGSTVDVSFSLPVDLDYLWNNVISSTGLDILVTTSNGRTLQTFDLTSYNNANRTGTVTIDNISIGTTDGIGVAWLVWNEDAAIAGNPTDRSTTFAPASAKTAVVSVFGPAENDIILDAPPVSELLEKLPAIVQKSSTSKIPIWIDITKWFLPRQKPYNYSKGGDGPKYITFKVQTDTQTAPVDETTMYSEGDIRLIETENGELLLMVGVQAGTANDECMGILTVGTAEGFIYEYKFQINIVDLAEAA